MIITEAGQAFEAELHNAPTGLTGVVGYRVIDAAGNVVHARTTVGIHEAPAGSGIYFATTSVPTPGNYLIVWDTDPGGVANPTNSTSEQVYATASVIDAPVADPSGMPGGPCEAWIAGADVATFCGITADPDDLTAVANWASQLLFMLSGRVYSGRCMKTVRPCRRDCSCFGDSFSPGRNGVSGWGWEWSSGSWLGSTGGAWYGGGGPSPYRCGCGCNDRVRLPYPTRDIIAVRIDGQPLDPATYRLDYHKWLVNLSGSAPWPACQDLGLPAGASGTFEIDIAYGSRPPVAGRQAAYALACQLYKMTPAGGGACDMPPNVTQVIRQGITQQTAQVLRLSKDGFVTGIPAIDVFLAAYNPRGIRRHPAVWSPDVQQTARKVGQ